MINRMRYTALLPAGTAGGYTVLTQVCLHLDARLARRCDTGYGIGAASAYACHPAQIYDGRLAGG